MFADYNSDYEPTLTRGPGNWDHTLTEKKLSGTRPGTPCFRAPDFVYAEVRSEALLGCGHCTLRQFHLQATRQIPQNQGHTNQEVEFSPHCILCFQHNAWGTAGPLSMFD